MDYIKMAVMGCLGGRLEATWARVNPFNTSGTLKAQENGSPNPA